MEPFQQRHHVEKHLHLREFSDAQKLKMYESQGGVCPLCGKRFALEEMHADHVTPWCRGGQTTLENGQMLCHDCNWTKGKRQGISHFIKSEILAMTDCAYETFAEKVYRTVLAL